MSNTYRYGWKTATILDLVPSSKSTRREMSPLFMDRLWTWLLHSIVPPNFFTHMLTTWTKPQHWSGTWDKSDVALLSSLSVTRSLLFLLVPHPSSLPLAPTTHHWDHPWLGWCSLPLCFLFRFALSSVPRKTSHKSNVFWSFAPKSPMGAQYF